MRKCSICIDSNNPLFFIVATLTIISVIIYLASPQHLIIAKTNQNINTHKKENFVTLEKIKKIQDQKINTKNKLNGAEKVKRENDQKKQQEKEPINTKIEVKKPKIIVKRKKLVLVTAYSSTVDQTDSTPFITANGTHVHDGTIATNFLKFGTKVKFPSLYGDKIFIVEDRMKSNYKVDIWFPTRQEAINFGVKRVEIEILE